jgi:predicted O-methyltransferase YrrM
MSAVTRSDEPGLLLALPILARMKTIDGWLWEEEADLLMGVTARALQQLPAPHALVEIGSYCGRSTVVIGSVIKALSQQARLYAIDPHGGVVGASDQGLTPTSPTLEKFRRNIAEAGLTHIVEPIQQLSYEVKWEGAISLLFIDGLHDRENVERDFHHFEPFVVEGGYIAFHDYADYYPGVMAFVDETLASGRFRRVHLEKSMMVVQKLPMAARAP